MVYRLLVSKMLQWLILCYLGTLTMPVTSAKAPKNVWNDIYDTYDYAEYDGYGETPYNGYGKRYTALDGMDETALLERCHGVLKTLIQDYKGRERVNKQSLATNSKKKKDYFGMGISWSYYDDDMK